ncbi:MAG: class I SAM-dependent methyltransferase [Flavitalea sp.]
MYSRRRIAIKYLHYYLNSSNGRGHGIHSPFVFDFIQKVLNDKNRYPEYEPIEALRKKLMLNTEAVPTEDFGAGSAAGKTKTVSSIAANAAKSPKYGQFLFRFTHHYSPRKTLELGTSLGISSAYIASANNEGELYTAEGNAAVAAHAKKNLHTIGINNARMYTGEFDNTLPIMLKAMRGVDLAFVDGNHRKVPTLHYFSVLKPEMTPASAIIFDDIHWSEEMESAWENIKKDPAVMLSIDLFFLGIVFFRPEFKVKQHFVIRF